MPFKIKNAAYVKGVFKVADVPKDPFPEVAFAGRSNVGKSSVLNKLANIRNLAKISSTPGKTRQINFFLINENLYFVDLPGYGYAKVSKSMKQGWGRLVEEYLKKSRDLKGVVLLIDARHEPFEADLQLLEWLDYYQRKKLVVLTKTDKLSRSALLLNVKNTSEILNLDSDSFVLFSAKTGEGKEKILHWISDLLICRPGFSAEGRNTRQKN
jgi:GTP-binding protein